MLIEIPYNDLNGSICPICGANFEHVKRDTVTDISIYLNNKSYQCVCAHGHLAFIRTETSCEEGYDFYIRVLVTQSDWENVMNTQLPIGPYVFQPIQYEELMLCHQ